MKTLILLLLLISSPAWCQEQTVSEKNPKSVEQLFLDPSPMIARRISIVGYLRWGADGRDLYPVGVPKKRLPPDRCLPLLVTNDNEELEHKSSSLNGKTVRIDGIIAYTSDSPGMITVNTCKQLGLFVISIEEIGK